jgi:hypothetical protein
MPVSDACSHGGRGTVPAAVTTEDLTRDPLAIEIKDGKGTVVASRGGPLYTDGLQRTALCIGAKAGGFTNHAHDNVDAFTFFLAPAGTSLPPAPAAPPVVVDWTGSYEFSEDCGPTATGYARIVIGHRLMIARGADGYTADLDSDGYQTAERLHLTGRASAESLELVMDRTRPQNMYDRYRSGDVLFTLTRTDVGLSTTWKKYEPACSQKSPQVYFQRAP